MSETRSPCSAHLAPRTSSSTKGRISTRRDGTPPHLCGPSARLKYFVTEPTCCSPCIKPCPARSLTVMCRDGCRGKRLRRSTSSSWNHGSESMERCTPPLAVRRRRPGRVPPRPGPRRRVHLPGSVDIWNSRRGQPRHRLAHAPSRPWDRPDDGEG